MPKSGERVGEYVLEERVGAGAFGEVWRARHHVWNERVVAVKVPTDPEYLRMLQSEGAAVHGLEHPNVVRAINFDPYAVPPYLAMEYVPGTSLRPLIEQKAVTPVTATQMMLQVLAGLGYAHSRGMIHRDIKPENILVHERWKTQGLDGPGSEGLVKLTDFGLGQKTAEFAANSIAYTVSIQGGGELAGTIGYMSPEQRSGRALDARSDIYSCGVILFEMLTGERPAGTELPSEVNRSVPVAFDGVFKRAYARLEARFASAAEFAQALTAATGQGGKGTTTPPALPSGGRPVLSRCPTCKASVSDIDQFCMSCGTQLVESVRRCSSCGAYPHPNDRFCMSCGTTVSKPSGAGAR